MSPNVAIRPGTAADYDVVIPLLNEWWGGRAMQDMLPRLFFTHFAPWLSIAMSDGAIVGFLAGFRSQSDPAQVYCHFIGVSPEARGMGVGEALYGRLFADALAAGCTEARAVTSPLNTGSIRFHRRLGFEVVPGTRETEGVSWHPDYDGPGEDRVCFRRNLQKPNV
ncbi:MAG: GNAT family N-acetyltransferase [Thermomicrobiales bacterium]